MRFRHALNLLLKNRPAHWSSIAFTIKTADLSPKVIVGKAARTCRQRNSPCQPIFNAFVQKPPRKPANSKKRPAPKNLQPRNDALTNLGQCFKRAHWPALDSRLKHGHRWT